jgi:hypothetical protein
MSNKEAKNKFLDSGTIKMNKQTNREHKGHQKKRKEKQE